jgi:3'-phosphoadenosine 5'-phosphosulfate sulfotransferase (PAPS reductase)/FAD synthetase
LKTLPQDKLAYVDAYAKTQAIMNSHGGENIRVAYSGGADSDTVMWLLRYLGYSVPAIFYNTGLEYAAAFRQIEYMRSEGFEIEIIKPEHTLPSTQIKYGNPFISKNVSNMLHRLQYNNFDFIKDGNKSKEELNKLYPKTNWAISWWTNANTRKSNNVAWNKGLKEFLTTYGLPFRVSDKCCEVTKKRLIANYAKKNSVDLMILGLKQVDGGSRTAINSCYVPKKGHSYSMYFPLYWWKRDEKREFDKILEIKHSDCYGVYGLERSGCAACPFGRKFEEELVAIDTFEPRLSNAVRKIFSSSYEWTRKYKEFVEKEYKQ